jgi:hypothetical protein
MIQNPAYPATSRSSFLPLVLLSLGLIALAHVGAEVTRWPGIAGPEGGHTVTFYRVIFTIWVTTLLVTPALCSFVLLRPGDTGACWRWLWTMAYVAFLFHVYWTVWGTFHGNIAEIFNSHSKMPGVNRERVVDHPGMDFLLTFWWGLDVALAWLVTRRVRWIRLQRSAVHFFTFIMFFGALVLAAKGTLVARLLGIVFALVVMSSFVRALIFRESDPDSLLLFVHGKVFQLLNRFVPWHRLPKVLAIANILALREVLRAKNLHDTSKIPVTNAQGARAVAPNSPRYLVSREPDGFYNDLAKPTMGSASLNLADPLDTSEFTLSSPGARFGRNIPLSEVQPESGETLLEPNPRLISQKLLSRGAGGFQPAPSLNLLAAAWIQFQVHDWFNHGNPVKGGEIEVPIPTGDQWHQCPMRVRRTRPDPTRAANDGAGPPTFANAESHWWDGSQIYGSSQTAAAFYRAGRQGKLAVDAHELLLVKQNGLEKTAFTGNWWIGLSLLHTLFANEHNAICDQLALEYPDWDDDQLYATARLVNVALMAKIHSVDWTPAILAHPAVQVGLRGNWFGLATEKVRRAFGRISENEAVSGIPGSATDHHGADYCLTEEFVSVYRMHPLMPDQLDVHAIRDGRRLQTFILGAEVDDDPSDVVGPRARTHALADGMVGMADLFYSMGRANPGALTLHNYPDWMRHLRRRKSDGEVDEIIDLAAIDILRDRERGVPRYNRFRELFHLPRVNSFEQLTSNPQWARELREVYGDVDRVDLMVGLFAEAPPPGFGFSDTAFRVFILMASRRLKSDRFLTTDFTPAVYSQAGLDWIENNGMRSVLLRHFPALGPALYHVVNPFEPWNDVGAAPRR